MVFACPASSPSTRMDLFSIVVSTVASQHESPTVQSILRCFCTEVFLYAVCMFSLHTPVSSHSPKTCMNRPQVWIFECLSASALWQMGNLSSVLPMTSGLYVNTENRMCLQVWDWAHPKHSALWDMAMLLLHMHNTEHLLSYTTARQVEQTVWICVKRKIMTDVGAQEWKRENKQPYLQSLYETLHWAS